MEVLITEVHKHSVLWDKRDKNYKNKHHVDQAWKTVARETDLSKEEARNKWKNLRDTFMKELRKIEKPTSDDSVDSNTGVYTGKWMYFDLMTFLTSTHLHRPTERKVFPATPDARLEFIDASQLMQNSITGDEVDLKEEFDEDTAPATSHVRGPPAKRPRQMEQDRSSCSIEQEDADLNFFKSLIPCMRKLSDVQKLRVRSEFHSVLIRELSVNNTE